MKFLCIFLLFPLTIFAGPIEDHLAKMTKVIKDDGRASFCVASVPKGEFKNNPRTYPSTAVCVGDIVLGKGMQERNGCGAFILNVNNLNSYPLLDGFDYNLISGKKCAEGGFELVMNDLLMNDNTGVKPKRVPVSYAFVSPYRLPDRDFDVVIVYNEKNKTELLLGRSTKWETWFNKARSEFLADLEKQNKRKPSSN